MTKNTVTNQTLLDATDHLERSINITIQKEDWDDEKDNKKDQSSNSEQLFPLAMQKKLVAKTLKKSPSKSKSKSPSIKKILKGKPPLNPNRMLKKHEMVLDLNIKTDLGQKDTNQNSVRSALETNMNLATSERENDD